MAKLITMTATCKDIKRVVYGGLVDRGNEESSATMSTSFIVNVGEGSRAHCVCTFDNEQDYNTINGSWYAL